MAQPDFRLSTFRFDVTPPLGHSLCGGWIPAVSGVDDPLEAIGLVIRGAGRPIVLCAVDWTGLCNDAHRQWRTALAEGAGTEPERVAVQCVHQHDAPFACLETDRIVRAQGDLPPNLDPDFFRACLKKARQSVAESLRSARPLTHVAASQAMVERVASNRRILGDDGRVRTNRSVAPGSEAERSLPAGVIDPWLKTVAFYDGADKLAACHYYAVHPISYCCQEGRVSSEFVGIARRLKEQHDAPRCAQIYFTGCAGNINTGKYNDSSVKANRRQLAERVYAAMELAAEGLKPQPVRGIAWSTRELRPEPRRDLHEEDLLRRISDPQARVVHRNRPAFALAWLRRCAERVPIVLSGLQVNQTMILHLPGEPFVEYQLAAQSLRPDRFVAVAGYGDGGPWYLPTAESYRQGGYEVNVAYCEPRVDLQLRRHIAGLLEASG